jgi:cation:H+ antiporter
VLGPAIALFAAFAGMIPWVVLHFMHVHLPDLAVASVAGLAILCAAFLLSWSVEVAEIDVPPAIAISVLALIAVLPEYAVDATFAWKAATDPVQAGYAVANMTGGNRLLLGVGWATIVLLAFVRLRLPAVRLPITARVDVAVLLLASAWVLVPIYLGRLSLIDTGVMVLLYFVYVWAASRVAPAGDDDEHEELIGPADLVSRLPRWPRWAAIAFILIAAAGGIFVAAEPFAEALVHTGKSYGIDEFLLVQWLAPFASEAPEFLVAALITLRGHAAKGLLTLVSSKVNQWTLLIGTLPLVTTVAAGEIRDLPLDARQQEEVLLTAAQSLFGVALLGELKLGRIEAFALLILFSAQLFIQGMEARLIFSGVYLALAVLLIIVQRRLRAGLVDALRTTARVLMGGRGP